MSYPVSFLFLFDILLPAGYAPDSSTSINQPSERDLSTVFKPNQITFKAFTAEWMQIRLSMDEWAICTKADKLTI